MHSTKTLLLRYSLLTTLFISLPSSVAAFQLVTKEGPTINLPAPDPIHAKTPYTWGKTLPTSIKDGFVLDPTKTKSGFENRYGCPPANNCDYHFQHRVQKIIWPTATYTNYIEIIPTGQYNYDFDSPGVANVKVNYDSTYVKKHEDVHVRQDHAFLAKHFKLLVDWAKNYIGNWFNSQDDAAAALELDFQTNYTTALASAQSSWNPLYKASDHDNIGSVVRTVTPPADPSDPWTLSLKDKDESWRSALDDSITLYKPKYALINSPGQDPIPCSVPAPLPILGLGVAFRYSRKIRAKTLTTRIKVESHLMDSSINAMV
jgi:hypothetical protein